MTRLIRSTRLALALAGFTVSSAMAATDDMQGMDHSQMPGMDHSQMQSMDHSQMQSMDDGQMQPAAPTQSRTPIPALTDADRAAVYASPAGHAVHDTALNHYFLADKLEWQDADDGNALAWDLSGWIGGDIDRLWLRSEGERVNGKTEDAEVQALWGPRDQPMVGRGDRRAPGFQTRRSANLGRVRRARHGAVQLRSRSHGLHRRRWPDRRTTGR